MATKYPIVIVHGMMSFNKIFGFPLFFGIQDALIKEGHATFIPTLSANNTSEIRGEQLIKEIKKILAETGADKVNLIGHCQGSLTGRYVASTCPQYIASMTSVSGANHGSEIADVLEKTLADHEILQKIVVVFFNLLGKLFTTLSGKPEYPQDFMAALQELTTTGTTEFNLKYPQGLPDVWGGEGKYIVNGIYYFSWSGIIKGDIYEQGFNIVDPTHILLVALSKLFSREKENDGLVGRYSSHLGKVIRSDYSMDHLDAINQMVGITPSATASIKIFTEHAKLLENSGL